MTKSPKIELAEGLPAAATDVAPAIVPEYPEAGDLRTAVGSEVAQAVDSRKKIDLQIDWDSLDREAIFKSLKEYDKAEDFGVKLPDQRHDVFIIHSSEVNTKSGEKLVIEFSKVISTYDGITQDELQIGILRPDMGPSVYGDNSVAAFDFLCNRDSISEEWDMKHRATFRPYQGQGIAGSVLTLAEEIFKKRSEDNKLAQSISAKSGQKDLTAWLENPKRGFAAATSDDASKLERLKSPENGLIEVTNDGRTYTFDPKDFEAKFGDKVKGPEDLAVWDDKNYKEPFFYMRSCFKIKLKKAL